MATFRNFHTDNAPRALGPYSQAVESNGVLYFSGQIGIDPKTGDFPSGDIASQAHQACKNIKAIILAAGLTLKNVVKTTCFLANMDDFAIFNEVYGKYFAHKPARSCVAVKELPKGALCEIEVIAVR